MQIKIFTIPLFGGDAIEADMNAFLRGNKVLKVESKLANKNKGAVWTFEIRYIDGAGKGGYTENNGSKKDYREILDEKTFGVYSKLREIRKKIAEKDGLPPFAVFSNEELAEISKLEKRDMASIQGIPGIGAKKAQKYAQYFTDEANQPPA